MILSNHSWTLVVLPCLWALLCPLLSLLPTCLASLAPQCPLGPKLWAPHPYVEGLVGGLSPPVLECRLCRPPNMSPQTLKVVWRRGDGRSLPSSSSPSFHSYSPHPDTHLLKLRRTPLAASMFGNYTCSLEKVELGSEATVEVEHQIPEMWWLFLATWNIFGKKK